MIVPFSGITLIVSALILTLGFISRRILLIFPLVRKLNLNIIKDSPALSSVIIATTVTCSILLYGWATNVALSSSTLYSSVYVAMHQCHPLEQHLSNDKNIVLRLDDVQAHGWTGISIQMMEDALNRGMPVVAGVIPHILDTDQRIVRFLRVNNCNVEIAMHGYTHGISEYSDGGGEFADISFDEATQRLELSQKVLDGVSHKPITTFIPPRNQISTEAILAVHQFGIPIISSEGKGTFDYHASTWDFGDKSFSGAEGVINDCETRFSGGDTLCVIMLHPQDFANDDLSLNQEHYYKYLEILDYIQSNNIPVVTFEFLAKNMTQ